MKVFAVYGYTKTGKTTSIERIIEELRERRYSVGTVKEIHYEQFKMDAPGTNTHRHKVAGASQVTARGLNETDILYQRKLTIPEILKHYDHDYVICEGATDYNLPKIITGSTIEDLDKRWGKGIFAITGKIAENINEYRGVPAINALTNSSQLVDLIEEKVFSLLPDVKEECCSRCGTDCRSFCDGLIKGIYKESDCIQKNKTVEVFINEKPLDMVPFVQDIIESTIRGMIGQLDGYMENSDIRIKINEK